MKIEIPSVRCSDNSKHCSNKCNNWRYWKRK